MHSSLGTRIGVFRGSSNSEVVGVVETALLQIGEAACAPLEMCCKAHPDTEKFIRQVLHKMT